MAGNSDTAPAQTREEIVAALRAQEAQANYGVLDALRNLLPLGGAVDFGNAVAKAYQNYQQNIGEPFAQTIRGGVRGYFGLPLMSDANETGREAYRNAAAFGNTPGVGLPAGAVKSAALGAGAVAGMLGILRAGGKAPAGGKALTGPWAKEAGVIIPFSAAQATRAGPGVSKIADEARRTYIKTGDNTKVLTESNKALKDANFPMAIEGFYFGPDGKMRASLSNQAFKGNFNPQLFQVDPAGNISLGKPLLGGQNAIHAEIVLPHESLYKLMPELKDTRIRHDPTMKDPVLGSYDRKANIVNLPGVIQADPNHSLISTLIHELTHAGQNFGKTRYGSAPNIDDLIGSLNEARKMGTFTTKKEIDDAINTLTNIELSRMYPGSNIPNLPANPDEYIFNVYRSIFGEVEARQSQNMTPGRLPNISRLERSY